MQAPARGHWDWASPTGPVGKQGERCSQMKRLDGRARAHLYACENLLRADARLPIAFFVQDAERGAAEVNGVFKIKDRH